MTAGYFVKASGLRYFTKNSQRHDEILAKNLAKLNKIKKYSNLKKPINFFKKSQIFFSSLSSKNSSLNESQSCTRVATNLLHLLSVRKYLTSCTSFSVSFALMHYKNDLRLIALHF